MSDVSVSLATPQVTVVEGRGSVTASVTAPAAERVVVAVVRTVGGDVPSADPAWATVDRPLRALAAGATEQYALTFVPPAGTAPGLYEAKVVAYPADAAPEEYASRGQVVRLDVPPTTAPPTPRTGRRWWPWVLAAVVLLAAVATVVVLLTRPDPPPPEPEPLDLVGSWTLVEGVGPDGPFAPVSGSPVSFVVNENGEAGGSTGCNGYGGIVTVDGTSVTVSEVFSTLIFCSGPVGEVERAYLDALEAVTEGAREGDALFLGGDQVELTFTLAD